MIKYNPDLVYQVIRAKMLNKRRPIASTKDRSEVSGGGRKPWPQKGTGRARAGSIRSPLWKGGGVTFGPRPERSYRTYMPKKMVTAAFGMVLQKKQEDDEVIVVDAIDLSEPKTKLFAKWMGERTPGGSTLVVSHKNLEMLKRAGRNIPFVGVLDSKNVDILDMVTYRYLVVTKEALKQLKERTNLR